MRCEVVGAGLRACLLGGAGLLLSCARGATTGADAEVPPQSAAQPPAERAPTAPSEAPPPTTGEAPAVGTNTLRGCESPSKMEPERLELSLNSASTTASGMRVHFAGRTTDHFEDGGFDEIAEMRLSWGEEEARELVSLLAFAEESGDERRFRSALDHCWRIAEHDERRVLVDVLPADPDGPQLPACADRAPASEVLPLFDSYYAAAEGARFRARIEYDRGGHAWVVRPQPRILRHHGTRMEWSNLAEQGRAGLGLARDRPVQVSFRFVSSTVRKVPGEHRWRSEHVAVIESACLP